MTTINFLDVDYAALTLHHTRVLRQLQKLNHSFATIAQAWSNCSATEASLTLTFKKVIVALATLQSSVQDLSRAYINHANTVLNPGRTGTLDVGLTNTLVEAGLINANQQNGTALGFQLAGSDDTVVPEGKKKRKRAKHDPNAPKRALTPYFLYMQTARSQIAKELGDNAKPKEVADEGTRRWGGMKEADKMVLLAGPVCNISTTC